MMVLMLCLTRIDGAVAVMVLVVARAPGGVSGGGGEEIGADVYIAFVVDSEVVRVGMRAATLELIVTFGSADDCRFAARIWAASRHC